MSIKYFTIPEGFEVEDLHFTDRRFKLKFHDEYMNRENKNMTFTDFLSQKDLGIECHDAYAGRYFITDPKKWMLSKIKYGL